MLAAALLVTGAGMGGCGSSAGSSSPAATGPTGATALTTPASVTIPTVVVAGPKYCQELVEAEQSLAVKLPTITSEPSAVGTMESTYRTLATEAPPAIKSSVQDVAGAIAALAPTVTDPAAEAKALPGIESRLGPDEEAIGTWAGTNCHAG